MAGKRITSGKKPLTPEQKRKRLEAQTDEFKSESNIDFCFNHFLIDRLTAGKSNQTLASYKNYYNKLSKYFKEVHNCSPKDIPVDFLTKDICQMGFMMYMQNQNLSIQTVNFYLRGHRAFGNFCEKQGYIEHFTCQITEKAAPVKQVYNLQEKQALREKPDYPIEEHFLDWRTYCIVGLILNIGIRSNSVLNIKIKDVDLHNGDIYINISKTGKVERQGLAPVLIKDLTEWINFLYSKGLTEDNYLFCNDKGEQLSRSGLCKSLRIYNSRKGVEKTSIHLLRHTFTKDMIQDGADVFTLQRALMHSGMDMVQRYANLYAEDVKREVLKHSSLSQLERKKDELIKAPTPNLIRGKKKK